MLLVVAALRVPHIWADDFFVPQYSMSRPHWASRPAAPENGCGKGEPWPLEFCAHGSSLGKVKCCLFVRLFRPLVCGSRDNCPSRMDVQARWPAGQSQRCSVEFCLFVCFSDVFSVIIEGVYPLHIFLKICLIGGVRVKWPFTCDFLYKSLGRNKWSRIRIFWNPGGGYMGLIMLFSPLLYEFDYFCNKTNCMWVGGWGVCLALSLV